jgi:hypothetical protein
VNKMVDQGKKTQQHNKAFGIATKRQNILTTVKLTYLLMYF